MVHLIHRKRVPLLHNSVLILCDEGDGLVAMSKHGKLGKITFKVLISLYTLIAMCCFHLVSC